MTPGTMLGWAGVAVASITMLWLAFREGKQPAENEMTDGAPTRGYAEDPALYVFVEDDGSARELTPDEQDYLATEFIPGDGGRPYIKGYYRQRTPDGHLRGFLARSDLPRRIVVRPAPPPER